MKIRILSLAVALSMLAACDDDDGGTPAYEQMVADSTMCVGTFAQINRGTLEAATTSGACANDQSRDAICTTDIAGPAATCGKSCVTAHFGDDAQIKSCTDSCLLDALASDPTDACVSCYSDTVLCTAKMCQSQCLADASAPACLQCQAQNCLPAFFGCSGLPAPQAGDAGP